MNKWINYEVEVSKGHVIEGKTLQSLSELKREHKEIGYKLISYNGRRLLSSFLPIN